MTRKDYNILACCLGHSRAVADLMESSARADGAASILEDLTQRLRIELKVDNAKFDAAKFSKRVDDIRRA